MAKMRSNSGFSLIELLVVIVSIMILTGITLASLGRAKEFARVTTCLSNLHQLSLAAIAYSVSDRGAFPSDCQTPGNYWYPQISRYDSGIASNALCPDALEPSSGIGTAVLAWGKISTSGPPYSAGYPWAEGVTSSYGMNTYVNPGDYIPLISSFGSISVGGNQTYRGDIESATGIGGNGNVNIYGSLKSGGAISLTGGSYVSGSQIPNIPDVQPPSVTDTFQYIEQTFNPMPVASSKLIDFSQNAYQIINGNFNPSGQIQIIGSGTLLVTGNVDISGYFPANGSGSASMNIIALGNISFSGQTNISGAIYAGGNLSIDGRSGAGVALQGEIVTGGGYSSQGKAVINQGPVPPWDPRVRGGQLVSNQPLFLDSIWVDGTPQPQDPVPENLELGAYNLSTSDEMGRFCINRHVGQVNVSFTDGSAHTVALSQLWQLQWSSAYTPQNVVVPMSW
jgi:prepilin-type processing-associated H-X9-DG protein